VARALIHVEGETEETFVNELLSPHLQLSGYSNVGARLLGNARQRNKRGGIRAWPSVRTDILNHLKEDSGCLATTMVDYYALPQSGPGAWPGSAEARTAPFATKAQIVEEAIANDIRATMGPNFDVDRFVPFVIMHEFEGLLFSDCDRFAEGIGRTDLRESFQTIRNGFNTPEEINDSPHTAPSKRVLALFPNYEKPLFGTLAASRIGLDAIRAECPHFNDWVTKLEAWP
jgi:hypothetical protein